MPNYAPGIRFESGGSMDRPVAMASTSLTAFVGVDVDTTGEIAHGELKLIAKIGDVDRYVTANDESSLRLKKVMGSYFVAGGSFCYLAHVNGADEESFSETLATALDRNKSLSLIAFPGLTEDTTAHAAAYAKIKAYADTRKDLFILIDPPADMTYNAALTYFAGLTASSYAAAYFPWVTLNGAEFIPPSGLIAAQYGKVDNDVGVHQVAAGTQHGVLPAIGVQTKVSQNQHDAAFNTSLDNFKLNLIRTLDGYGTTIWGARTMEAGEFAHISVRRLFIFAEQSITESLQWVVFEPNNKALWGTVHRSITAFLRNLWLRGALVGNKENEAFYVKISEENNPPSERDAGKLNIEIGMAPSRPAEFIIIKLVQSTQS
ncbi:MAG: phage tail sheath family protein [Bdellovibrionales bacterium]